MIEIQYMTTVEIENEEVATKLDEIEADETQELVRTKTVVEEKEQEEDIPL